jgi:NAD(P) transhydrogenase subunit alpha
MMIYLPKERWPGETRIPLLPESAAKLVKRGAQVVIESGMGMERGISDDRYLAAGACVAPDADAALAEADLVLRLRRPPVEEIRRMKRGAILVGHLDPFNQGAILDACAEQGVDAISMEMIPRTTLAQKMDALSSQANLAGYAAVILGAARLDMALPMMMTPAGTLKPARVFIIGCGVAGLQAIATARRLGARVEAFDTRPVVEEQVQSLGAKFVKIDLGETGQTKDGYAKELTPEQRERQKEAMAKDIAQSDLVIAAAQVFGRRAPVIVTRSMIGEMRAGSVVVDLAIETGGNVEGAVLGEERLSENGVHILALDNMPGRVALHASQMYSANLCNLVEHFWDKTANAFVLNLNDEIMQGCLVVHNGAIRHPMILKSRESAT